MLKTYPPELEELVRQVLASGSFRNEEEVLIAALKVLQEFMQRHQNLRDDVQAALAEAGQEKFAPLDIETIKSELAQEITEEGHPI